MVKHAPTLDEKLRDIIESLLRSVAVIEAKVDEANFKLDHLIKTYSDERAAYYLSQPYDPYRDQP